MKKEIAIFWFRRDLRLVDNAGLYRALAEQGRVLPLFIYDRNILDDLEDRSDARVEFIHEVLASIKEELRSKGSDLLVKYATPEDAWREILKEYEVQAVYTNHDYEPYAKQRDDKIEALLAEQDIPFRTYKDHVIFEKEEIEKKAGGIYTVFTPYSKTWLAKLDEREATMEVAGEEVQVSYYLKPYATEKYFSNLHQLKEDLWYPSLSEMNFEPTDIKFPPEEVSRNLIKKYDETRDYPAIMGTSRLGMHFRFGTISIREKARRARKLNATFLSELIWRDFYAQILANFPHVAENSFRPEYDHIEWRNNQEEFEAWCAGKTGYPMVDAGMRQLNSIGYMHNRVRMVVASFLTKHLLIDWRWGEAYFAAKLLDFDLASNNGGWQWAAGSGTDAAPYFRIFNPASQLKKFDKDLVYVKRWVPEYGTDAYPEPIVDHKMARERCLARYKEGLARGREG